MTFDEYQAFAKQGWKPGCDDVTFALGLGGEAGEVLEILKKARRDQTPINLEHLKEEIGDTLWYIANLCTSFGLTLEDVIHANISKLCVRYAKPYDWHEHAEGKYSYKWNGPHIQKINAETGAHVKFCARSEVPPYVLERLDSEKKKMQEEKQNDEVPFD